VGDDLIWKVRGVCNGVGGPYSNVPEFHILFGDVPLAHPARSFIERLYRRPRTISENCGLDGAGLMNFCPTGALLRENAARWLIKAKYGPGHQPPAPTGVFLDVPPNDEFAPWIEELYHLGITAGCGGGNFCPNTALTRGQAAVLFLLAKEGSGYRPPACFMQMWDDLPCSAPFADWIYDLVWRSIGVLGCDGSNFCPNAPLTRADASS
jgi:hypothetical protein